MTAMLELIEKLNNYQREIIGESEYQNGKDSAINECINIAKCLLGKEYLQTVKFAEWAYIYSSKYPESNFGELLDIYSKNKL